MPSHNAIGPNDVISVHGQYLYQRDGSRFFMKGIAFPVSVDETYNATAWVGILNQLHALDLEYNTVRVYRMNPEIDYSEFFEAAASLGVYVIVPLTAPSGDGVLEREAPAPDCYHKRLYHYGVACLQNYLKHPNVLAGLLANEVMNSEESWSAAPCIKAYGRDLKLYMKQHNTRPLPLIYAAQHSGIGQVGDVNTMWLTLNYLTCRSSSSGQLDVNLQQPASSAIDIFGVNVESWCSSLGSFEFNEDGSAGSYYSLWLGLHQSTIPLVFTEMGCSRLQFDRDNGLHTPQGTRDWKQVDAVLHDMTDTWSGFCAYAYEGNSMFYMFQGGPWHSESLDPTLDFYNFRDSLKHAAAAGGKQQQQEPPTDFEKVFSPSCREIKEDLKSCCNIDLLDFSRIPSYAMDMEGLSLHRGVGGTNNSFRSSSLLVVASLAVVLIGMMLRKVGRTSSHRAPYQPVS